MPLSARYSLLLAMTLAGVIFFWFSKYLSCSVQKAS